jgi:MATE family multidrug resistance protein
MFGHFGFPALGMLGIGLGTAAGFWILLAGFIVYIWLMPKYHIYFKDLFSSVKSSHIAAIMRMGLPMGIMFSIDLSFLMLAVFFAGKLGTTAVAAQQIGLQITGLTFIILAGLSQAITVRIGHTWGAKDYSAASVICWSGLWMGTVLGLFFSILLWFKPLWLIGFDFDIHDPNNAEIIRVATVLLVAFGFFQLANTFRYTFFAVLRGLKDTIFPAVFSLIGFYGIAIGLGYPLLFHWHGTLFQFWMLTSAAILLIVIAMYFRFKYLISKSL